MNTNQELIEHLKKEGVLKSKTIVEALSAIDRKDFVGQANLLYAYEDDALPIGFGQTISQPLTVVFMLELLELQEGQNIMDVGFGSAWQACLLSYIVGTKGSVHAIELIPEIYESGKKNALKYENINRTITFYCQNGKQGLPEVAKNIGGFDRIICAAYLIDNPVEWKKQLKVGGILVYPKNDGIYKEVKTDQTTFKSNFYWGFSFVPLVGN